MQKFFLFVGISTVLSGAISVDVDLMRFRMLQELPPEVFVSQSSGLTQYGCALFFDTRSGECPRGWLTLSLPEKVDYLRQHGSAFSRGVWSDVRLSVIAEQESVTPSITDTKSLEEARISLERARSCAQEPEGKHPDFCILQYAPIATDGERDSAMIAAYRFIRKDASNTL